MPTLSTRRNRILWSILLCLSLIGFPLISHALFVEDVPNPQQQSGVWVTDMANILSERTETQLNQMISELEATTGAELAVVTVPTTSPSPTAKAFTTELFNTWQIGKEGEENGVLFLTSVGDRRVEIETGYGVESILPDAQVAEIINTQITPKLRGGDWDGGILAGTIALVTQLSGNPPVTEFSDPSLPTPFLGITALIATIFSFYGYKKVKSRTTQPLSLEPQGRSLVISEFDNRLPPSVSGWIYGIVFSLTFALILLLPIVDPSGRLWQGFAILSLGVGTVVLSINLGRRMYHSVTTKVLEPKRFVNSKLISMSLTVLLLGLFSVLIIPIGGNILSAISQTLFMPWPSFREFSGLFLFLCVLVSSLVSYVISPWIIAQFLAKVLVNCRKCQTPLLQINPESLSDRFNPPQQVAQRLGSTRFEGWHCSHCYPDDSSPFHLRRYLLNQERFSECPHCQEFTMIVIEQQTLKKATYERGGILQIVYECQSCHHREDTQKKIPRLTHDRSSSYNGGYGGDYGGGGGGFSGGGGSGGFGGGSSGGGGAGGDF